MIPYSPGCNIIFSPVFGRICPAGFGVHTRGIYGMTHASIVGFVGGGQMGLGLAQHLLAAGHDGLAYLPG
jgi:hypothetical protein